MANKKNKQAVPVTSKVPKGGGSAAEATMKLPAVMKLAFLLAVISMLVYGNTLRNGFVMDDQVMITHNAYVMKGVSAIPQIFITPHQRGFWELTNDEYRPLPLALFALEYSAFGPNPMPFHLMNIILFAACVVLLFSFLDKLFEEKRTAVAFVASLLFALHPIHTEVVANIKSSDELLSFLFGFLSLNVFMKYSRTGNKGQLLAGFACMFLAYISKETVVTFLAIIPLVFFFYNKVDKKRSMLICGAALAATVLFVAIRTGVLNHYHANNLTKINVIENALVKDGLAFESRIATAILILGHYVRLLVVPYPLVAEYSFKSIPFVHFSNPLVWLTLLFYVAIGVYAVIRFVKDRKDAYAFGIFFFLVTIALFSNIFLLVKATMAERFLFFPSVGFCLVVALLLVHFLAKGAEDWASALKRPALLATFSVIGLLYSVVVVARNMDWVDNYTIYKTDLKKMPDNAHLNYLLGYELFSMAKEETNGPAQQVMMHESLATMRKSTELLPEYYYAKADLGAAYFWVGMMDSAAYFDKEALKLMPNATITRNNLAGVYMKTGKFRESIEVCKESIVLSPGNVYAYADMGFSFQNLNMFDSAIYYLQMGIRVDTNFYGNYDVLSYVYKAMGRYDSMEKYQNISKRLLNTVKQ